MPNLDFSHYFLTVLAPVRLEARADEDGPGSPAQHLKQILERLPTALQDKPSEASGVNSPFARNLQTHLTRFVVIDDTIFNGRVQSNTLLTKLKGLVSTVPQLTVPQPVDQLGGPYLLWAADVDVDLELARRDGEEAALRGYLTGLWNDMGEELEQIFRHCAGFETGGGAAGFCDYVIGCQVETTMPFNDYWTGAPPLQNRSLLPALAALVLGFVPLLALCWVLSLPFWCWILGVLISLPLAVACGAWVVVRGGRKPLGGPENSDLRSILKAIHLQQAFSEFAIRNQGADAKALHGAFGVFLEDFKPDDLAGPTQLPGVVSS